MTALHVIEYTIAGRTHAGKKTVDRVQLEKLADF